MRRITWDNPVYLDEQFRLEHSPVFVNPFKERGGVTVRDYSGKRYDGTLTNGPTRAFDKWGGPAISFDGADDYATLGTAFSPLTGDFTLSLWVYANAWKTSGSQYDGLICKRSGFFTQSFELYYQNPVDGGAVEGLSLGMGNSLAANIAFGVKPAVGSWQHIALTRSGNDFTCYLEGASAATATNATAIPSGSDEVVIGVLGSELAGNAAFHFNGNIANVVIGNRAVTAEQIARLYLDPYAMYWQPSHKRTFIIDAGTPAASRLLNLRRRCYA